ncbi:MAG: hypothetical protein LBI86_06345 [Treponema sp.]|jgi:hypothetical protein|nr:hypothetical protein [Treponema sp.]
MSGMPSVPVLVFVFLSGAFFPLWAVPKPAASSDLVFRSSTRPEAELTFNQRFIFPVLQGTGPLTLDNNVETIFSATITPISLKGGFEAVFTPAAFFTLSAGTTLGSGWNITISGRRLYGLAFNIPEDSREAAFSGGSRKSVIRGSPFDGLVWKVHGGSSLQFDTAALWPGAWRHIVFRAYNEVNYKAYTRAGSGETWVYEVNEDENRNGWNYYGQFFIGYRMPFFLNLAGIQIEVNRFLHNTPDGGLWGDKLGRWIFSGAFNCAVTPRFDALFAVQLRTMRNYLDGDRNNGAHYFYQYRELNRSSPLRLEFYRVALILSYRIKERDRL